MGGVGAEDFAALVGGLFVALGLTAAGFTGAVAGGTLLAACRLSPVPPLRWFGQIIVELVRNLPLLTLLVLVVFGLPDVGLVLPLPLAVVLCLALVNAALICEAIRSGVRTVAAGQVEAGRALGLRNTGVLRWVVLPQAARSIVPPLTNTLISTLLGSSLSSAVGVNDLIGVAQQINLREAGGVWLFSVAAVVYVLIALGIGRMGRAVEQSVAVRR